MAQSSMRKFPSLDFPVKGGLALYDQYRQLSSVALGMQTRGLRINQEAVKTHITDAHKRKQFFLEKFVAISGLTAKDVGEDGQTDAIKTWFWDVKHAPKIKAPKKKRPGLDTNSALMFYLTELDDVELKDASAALIGYRKSSKALSMLAAYDGPEIIHPSWNVTGTKGARWSCSGPNIQQLPAKDVYYRFDGEKTLLAANLKDIIVPHEGFTFIGSDYSALEVYLQAYLSGDELTLEWIERGEDLHINNARIFFGEEAVPASANKKTHKLEREVGKLGFGFSYNVTDHVGTTLKQMRAKVPAIDEEWVIEARKRYFAAHPALPLWQKQGMDKITRDGWDEFGLMGRRLYLEASTRGFNQRQNTTCQTLAGDMLNQAVIDLVAQGHTIAITWHDSIICEVPIDGPVKEVGAAIRDAMKGPFTINNRKAMFVAEPDVGPNLKDMVALEC